MSKAIAVGGLWTSWLGPAPGGGRGGGGRRLTCSGLVSKSMLSMRGVPSLGAVVISSSRRRSWSFTTTASARQVVFAGHISATSRTASSLRCGRRWAGEELNLPHPNLDPSEPSSYIFKVKKRRGVRIQGRSQNWRVGVLGVRHTDARIHPLPFGAELCQVGPKGTSPDCRSWMLVQVSFSGALCALNKCFSTFRCSIQ